MLFSNTLCRSLLFILTVSSAAALAGPGVDGKTLVELAQKIVLERVDADEVVRLLGTDEGTQLWRGLSDLNSEQRQQAAAPIGAELSAD